MPNSRLAGIGDLVGGDEPRPQHGIRVGRLAEAAVLGAAHRDVEADAIAGDVSERVGARNVLAAAPDDDGELDLVIVAPPGPVKHDFLARPDDARVRLQEEAVLVDGRGEALVRGHVNAVVDGGVGGFLHVQRIIQRRGDDVGRIGDGRIESHARERNGRSRWQGGAYFWQQIIKIGDEDVAERQRPAQRGKRVGDSLRHVANNIVLDHAHAFIVKAADLHRRVPSSRRRRGSTMWLNERGGARKPPPLCAELADQP